MYRIFYNSFGTGDLYALIRGELPAGCGLATLDADDDDERCERIADCDAVIVAAYPLKRRVVEAGRRLRVVHHQGVGYHDTVDLDALRERSLPLAVTPGGTTEAVAEHAIGLMLSVLRHVPFADRELRDGRWHINSLRTRSRELRGRTVGYVGMGRIAQAVAERLKPFGAAGLYHDPYGALSPSREAELGVRQCALDTLLGEADVVTVHVPLTPETRHLISARALGLMKPDAILVNTARGPIVDEAALAEALAGGRLLGAGLDVFEVEPLPRTSPLVSLPNVVLTPHFSAGTRDAMQDKMRFVLHNLHGFLTGGALENAVDLDQPQAAA